MLELPGHIVYTVRFVADRIDRSLRCGALQVTVDA